MGIGEYTEKLSELERGIRRLVYTSVDDCRSSLEHIHDLPFLEAVLVRLEMMDGQISRRKVVGRRIRQIRRSEGCG